MNYDEIKDTLLEIIKEAKNLPVSELDVIPGTNISVKRGRIEEFKHSAYDYFQMEHNVRITDDIDYVTDVYNMIEQEVLENNEDYYTLRAYNTVEATKKEVENFENLKKSLVTIDDNYKVKQNILANLAKNPSLDNWQAKIAEVSDDLKNSVDAKEVVTNKIKEARTNINNILIEEIEEQLKIIRESFLNTNNGTILDYGIDGESILGKDKPEYDNLYTLLQILRTANNIDDITKLVSVDNVMVVSEDQRQVVEELLPNINLFKKIQVKKSEEPKNEEDLTKEDKKGINDKLVSLITKELRSIETKTKKAKKKTETADNGIKILDSSIPEYNNLLKILNLLQTANESDWELVGVWNVAYVKSVDKVLMEQLLRDTKLFNDKNPDIEKIEENEKLILELKNYLNDIGSRFNQYKGTTNIPSKKTKDNTIVLKDDEVEYNTILDIISMLEDSNRNLITVWNIGSVSYENIPKFKKLVNATKYFSDRIPSIVENDNEIKNINKEIAKLIKRAKDAENAELDANGLVLKEDAELYKALVAKYSYLESAKASDNLVDVDGVKIAEEYLPGYKKAVAKIDEEKAKLAKDDLKVDIIPPTEAIPQIDGAIDIEPVDTPQATDNPDVDLNALNDEAKDEKKEKSEEINSDINKDEIAKVKEAMALLEENAKNRPDEKLYKYASILEEDALEYGLLKHKLKMLEDARKSNNTVEVDDVILDSDSVSKYQEIEEQLAKITEQKLEPKPIKEKPTKRKRVSIRKMKDKAFKAIKEHKKTIIAVGLSLAISALSLTNLTSAIVYANSHNASNGVLFNILNSILSVQGLVNAGITVGGLGLANKLIKKERAMSILDVGKKVKQEVKKSREVQKEVTQNIVSNNFTQTELINAQIDYEAKMNEQAMEIDTLFDEIDENVQNDIKAEMAEVEEVLDQAQEDIQENIEKRVQELAAEVSEIPLEEEPVVVEVPENMSDLLTEAYEPESYDLNNGPAEDLEQEFYTSMVTGDIEHQERVKGILEEQAQNVQDRMNSDKITPMEREILERELDKINARIYAYEKGKERGL